MKKFILSTLLGSLATVAVACGYAKAKQTEPIICTQQYALCTSAQCIPDPDHPDRSICFCEVRNGKNYGHSPCDKRTPQTDKGSVKHLVSTFSLDDFPTKKNMTCPSGSPWSNCLDQPCVVDPLNPKKAICMCKIVQSGAYQTFGGNCDTKTCATGYWSGALTDANTVAVQAMLNALGLKESPQRFCPK